MGLNVLIQVMITSLFTYASTSLGFERLTVSFPVFSGINVRKVSARTAEDRDRRYFPTVPLVYRKMEEGVCAIATLFADPRLACDQRKVFREGIDATLKRFTRSTEGGITEYRHILFVRAFVFALMRSLELDKPSYGIRGTAYRIEERGSDWHIEEEV